MPGLSGPVVKPTGVLLTLESQYEADKKAIDKAVANQNTKPKAKDTKPTKTNNTYNIDQSSFPDNDYKGKPGWHVSGLQSLEQDLLLLEDPSSFDVDGSEGFVDSVKSGVNELIRIIKNFFTWLWELVYNRVKSLQRRIARLERNLKSSGIKLTSTVAYPTSVARLLKNEGLPNTPDTIVNRVADLHAFYKGLMSGEATLNKVAVELPKDVTKDAIINLVRYTAEGFCKEVCHKNLGSTGETLSEPLPGLKRLKVSAGDGDKISSFNIAMTNATPFSRDLSKPLIPDASIASRILEQVKLLLTDIERKHSSQSSLARSFEKVVGGLNKSNRFDNDASAREAYKFFTWLVNFQHKSMSAPMSYVFSTANAALDVAEAMIK